jgi:outer membrane usher protein
MQSGTPRFDNTTDLSWDYNSSTPFPNNPKVTGLISLAPTYNDYSTRIGLRGNHGLLDVNMRRTEPGSGYGNFVQNQMEMIGQTSLVFVGANAGFSRPVQDGFLLAKGVKSLRNTEVSINKNEVGYDAQSTYLGPAVLPSLYSYSPKAIRVNAIDPPLGTTIEKTQYLLYPGYRSGFLVTVGTDGDVVAMGTIKDHVGKLLEYKVLKVHSIEDSKHPPTTAFTNAAGRFQFAGLKPGKWKLDVVDLGSTTFVIPKSAIGIFQLGELKMDPIR